MAKVAWNEMTAFEKVIVEDYKLFEGLELLPLKSYQGMDTRPAWEFKTPMATGFYKPYLIKGSDRIEKITIGELHYMGRAKYCALNMTASNDYDLPIYACEFPESMDLGALRKGASAFHVDFRQGELFSSSGGLKNYMRLCFVMYEADQIEEGIKRLRQCLYQFPSK